MAIAFRKKIPFKDVLGDHNQKSLPEISNKSILIVDDVCTKALHEAGPLRLQQAASVEDSFPGIWEETDMHIS